MREDMRAAAQTIVNETVIEALTIVKASITELLVDKQGFDLDDDTIKACAGLVQCFIDAAEDMINE